MTKLLGGLMVVALVEQAGAQLPAIRDLGPPIASTTLKSITRSAVELPGSRLLIIDAASGELVLYDSALTVGSPVVRRGTDSIVHIGGRGGTVMRLDRDSSLVTDYGTLSYYVLDRRGEVVATHSVPRPGDGSSMVSMNGARPPMTDRHGQLVYEIRRTTLPRNLVFSADTSVIVVRDSTPLVRVDLATRRMDTVTWLANEPRFYGPPTRTASPTSLTSPIHLADDWTVLDDGTIAVVRAFTARIEWIGPDGSRRVTEHGGSDRRPLSAVEKALIHDSATKNRSVVRATLTNSSGAGQVIEIPFNPAPAWTIPDFRPVFRTASAFGGPDGQLWVTEDAWDASQAVLRAINPKGETTARLRLEQGQSVVGIGSGAIYVTAYDPTTRVWSLQKLRVPSR